MDINGVMNKEEFEKILKEANEIKDIQGLNGNFNFDSYMLGLYNGMESIIAMFEKRKPKYINGHDVKFLNDKEINLKQALIDIRKCCEDNSIEVNTREYGSLIVTNIDDILQIIDKVIGDDESESRT